MSVRNVGLWRELVINVEVYWKCQMCHYLWCVSVRVSECVCVCVLFSSNLDRSIPLHSHCWFLIDSLVFLSFLLTSVWFFRGFLLSNISGLCFSSSASLFVSVGCIHVLYFYYDHYSCQLLCSGCIYLLKPFDGWRPWLRCEKASCKHPPLCARVKVTCGFVMYVLRL